MKPTTASPLRSEVCRDLERQISKRTGRRVKQLTVRIVGGRVVLNGITRSYYVKQLAQHEVMEFLPGTPLDNDIHVDESI